LLIKSKPIHGYVITGRRKKKPLSLHCTYVTVEVSLVSIN